LTHAAGCDPAGMGCVKLLSSLVALIGRFLWEEVNSDGALEYRAAFYGYFGLEISSLLLTVDFVTEVEERSVAVGRGCCGALDPSQLVRNDVSGFALSEFLLDEFVVSGLFEDIERPLHILCDEAGRRDCDPVIILRCVTYELGNCRAAGEMPELTDREQRFLFELVESRLDASRAADHVRLLGFRSALDLVKDKSS
jgi:hypothetical protein